MKTITDLTIAGVQKRYATGTTPAELMAELRQQAEALSDHNIFIHLLSADELQPWLAALDEQDPAQTPLWGVPFVIKDNIDLAGVPTTAACEAFAYTPDESAFVVQRLIDAGALPLGKANLDQFATGLNGTRSPWGPCRNSFDKSLVSGGSSAGSAVSVALGLASFSLGTDTAGSGRIPAAFNNLIGVKPTRGLLSATGVVPACRSLDCVSIFALHADDANAVLAAAEGQDGSDGYSRSNPHDNRAQTYGTFSAPLTLGVIPEAQLRFFGDEDYEQAYQQTLGALQEHGVQLREIDYAPFDEVARLLYEGPWVAERYVATLPLIEEQPEAVFPVVRDIIAPGGKPSAAELFQAQYRLEDLRRRCAVQLTHIDALLTPTAGRLFSIEEMLQEPIRCNSELGYYMNFMNLLDMAAIAVPTAFTDKGLPFGITLGAPAFSDRRLLSIANRLQQQFSLPLASGSQTLPSLAVNEVRRTDCMELVVCGAHLDGMPLNWQLRERGAELLECTRTSADYRLFDLNEPSLKRPALLRVDEAGVAIDVEVWRLPVSELGSFLRGIAAPLGLGQVTLCDGRQVCGFIAEATAGGQEAVEISHFGGWRAYQSSLSQA
ncbi:allophanate hydrolase [Granulosicoccus sp. 3-233]|uniref:allophanate hydrolase n=1 Tax=Granulosicoccus sp. 3-233 TaxID=3417969 RepID=UPI003D331C9A